MLPLGDKQPDVAPSAFVAPGAYVIGTVHLGQESSVWYGAVLRGDTEPIQIGRVRTFRTAAFYTRTRGIR